MLDKIPTILSDQNAVKTLESWEAWTLLGLSLAITTGMLAVFRMVLRKLFPKPEVNSEATVVPLATASFDEENAPSDLQPRPVDRIVTYVAASLGLFGAYIALSIVGNSLGEVFAADMAPEAAKHVRVVLTGSLIIAAMILALFYLRTILPESDRSRFDVRPALRRAWAWPLLYLCWIPILASSVLLGIVTVGLLFPDYSMQTQEQLQVYQRASDWRIPAAILGAAISAPLFEELFFRGLVQGGLRVALSAFGAIALSSIFFVALHDPVNNRALVAPILALSVALGMVFEYSRNIWHAIALHLLHNAVVLVFSLAGME